VPGHIRWHNQGEQNTGYENGFCNRLTSFSAKKQLCKKSEDAADEDGSY
jgi:hypothetical protein